MIVPIVFKRAPICISVVIAFVATMAVRADTADYPKPSGYVNDFGNAIDTHTKKSLNSLCTQLDQQTHAQLAIVQLRAFMVLRSSGMLLRSSTNGESDTRMIIEEF